VPGEVDTPLPASELVVYRFSASLFFANASPLLDDIEKLVTRAPSKVKWFVLDAEALIDMDTTGADTLREVISLLEEHEVTFAVSRAHRPLVELLRTYGLLDEIGQDRFFATNREAAAAFLAESEVTRGC